MIKNELEQLGFTPEEINVYISLLEIGGGFVSSIARKAGAHRVTTYNTLENLEKKGFVRKTKRRNVKFYFSVNPQIILNQIEDNYNIAKKVVPELINLQNTYVFKPNIQFFEGKEQMKDVFDDLLRSETEVIGYTNFVAASELFPEYLDYYNKEVLKHGKKHRLLCPNDKFHVEYIEKFLKERIDAEILEIFAINPEQFEFKNAQYIYDNKVTTVSFDRNELMGVIIESPNNAETNRAIFNLAWLGATSFVAS
jgi:sugar-specific transcriptional regulator TrmB